MSKPISLGVLEAKLAEYLDTPLESVKTEESSYLLEASSKMHFNRSSLLEKLNGREDMVEDILVLIRSGAMRQLVDQLEKVVEGNDTKLIKSAAHSLKGASKSACFEQMAVFAEQLESSDFTIQKTRTLLHEIQTEMDLLEKELG